MLRTSRTKAKNYRYAHLSIHRVHVELLAKPGDEYGLGSLGTLRPPAIVVLRGQGEEGHL